MTGAAPAADGFDFACAAIARRHDHERYLACLYAPPSRRAALLALLAANHEVAKTAEVVSEPGIGQIRLQWWRETLEGVAAGRPRAHEVAVPLAEAVAGHGLKLDRLHAIIDAREADLEGEPPATLDDLEAYAAATAGELHAAMAEILDADPAVARDGGTAWGLLNSVTEFVDHERRARSNEYRMDSAWFGQGAQIKQRALDTALQLVA